MDDLITLLGYRKVFPGSFTPEMVVTPLLIGPVPTVVRQVTDSVVRETRPVVRTDKDIVPQETRSRVFDEERQDMIRVNGEDSPSPVLPGTGVEGQESASAQRARVCVCAMSQAAQKHIRLPVIVSAL